MASKSRNIDDFEIPRDEIGEAQQISMATRLSFGEGVRAVSDVFGSPRPDTRAKFLTRSAMFSVERSYRMTTLLNKYEMLYSIFGVSESRNLVIIHISRFRRIKLE